MQVKIGLVVWLLLLLFL